MTANEDKAGFNPAYISENIVLMRRKLKMSQKEFIQTYLTDEMGKAVISTGAYSNLENGAGKSSPKAAAFIARRLHADAKMFEMAPDLFAYNIDSFLQSREELPTKDFLNSNMPLKKNTSYTDSLIRIISDYLTDGIMAGEIKPGDKLPSDRELAEKFAVGRSTIREALRVISLIGLIEILPSQGTFVASDSSDFFLTPLSWTFLLGKKNVYDMINVRNMLEIGAARQASDLATEKDLADFASVINKMKDAHKRYDFQAFLALDMEFHLSIARCSQSQIIYDLLHISRKLLTLISKSGMSTIKDINAIYEEHMAVYEAIADRDGDRAAKSMQFHLEQSSTRYSFKEIQKKHPDDLPS